MANREYQRQSNSRFVQLYTAKTPPPGQKLAPFKWIRLDQIIEVQAVLTSPGGDIDQTQVKLLLVGETTPLTVYFKEESRQLQWLLNLLDVVN